MENDIDKRMKYARSRRIEKSIYYDYFDKNVLLKFYNNLSHKEITPLSKERIKELDNLCLSWLNRFSHLSNYSYRMKAVAERLITSSSTIGLLNATEIKYFYLKLVDPEFIFLQMAEIAQNQEELKHLCLHKFHIYDSYIIAFEKQIRDMLLSLNETMDKH